jgi:hypothetical protein
VADPVSWFLIERGWRVLDRDGHEVGTVEEVTGDENADIFDGLSVRSGFFTDVRYVPSERVDEITEGTVKLSLTRAEVEALQEFAEPPASLDISSEQASVTDRAAAPFVDEGSTPPSSSWWRRLLGR